MGVALEVDVWIVADAGTGEPNILLRKYYKRVSRKAGQHSNMFQMSGLGSARRSYAANDGVDVTLQRD